MKLCDRENMAVLGIFLGVTALIAALVLSLVSQWTAKPISEAMVRNRERAFHCLRLPEFDTVGESFEYDGAFFYPVLKDDKIVAFVGQMQRGGYGGEIDVLVGFTSDGKITSVQILRHKETPGLGANVCERKFQRTIFNLTEKAPAVPDNRLLDQFNGKSAAGSGHWQITKDGGEFDYLTGATVTSRAVTALVNDISRKFTDGVLSEAGEGER